jgi:hypothetical protein
VPSNSTWKIENGKWVWYEAQAPAMAPAGVAQGARAAATSDDAAVTLPKDFDAKAVAAAALSILQQVSVDKREITLSGEKASEERVVFHNGATGSVQLELTVPEIPGFTAKIDSRFVRAAADVPVVFRYEPADHTARRDPVDVQLTVQPLNQVFVIRVNFAAARALPK